MKYHLVKVENILILSHIHMEISVLLKDLLRKNLIEVYQEEVIQKVKVYLKIFLINCIMKQK